MKKAGRQAGVRPPGGRGGGGGGMLEGDKGRQAAEKLAGEGGGKSMETG